MCYSSNTKTDHSKHPKFDQADSIYADVLNAKDKVLNFFGPGLLESIYRKTLAHALANMGHTVKEEVKITVTFDGKLFDDIYLKADILVDDCFVIELKSISTAITPVHVKQLLSYMKLLDMPLGAVINFGACPSSENRVRRVILAGADGAFTDKKASRS